MDGTVANFDSMRSFGCEFGAKLEDLKSCFSFGSCNHLLNFIPDACHMLKLARNSLADVGEFIDSDGNTIKWKHIKLLHEIQENEGLKFGKKFQKVS